MDHRGFRLALVASFVLHAAALGAVALRPAPLHVRAKPTELPESWGGDTFEVDEVLGRGAAKTEAAPVPMAEPKAEPAPIPKTEPKSEPAPKTAPVPKAEAKPAPETEAAPRAPQPAVRTPASQAGGPACQAIGGAGCRRRADRRPSLPDREMGAPATAPKVCHPECVAWPRRSRGAVTAATNRDPFWDAQALGDAGSARLEIELDADGHITATNTGKEELAPPLRRLVDRTLLLLKTGRFALSAPGLSAGKEVFRIEVTLSRGAATEDYDNPRDTVSLGFDPPSPSAAGRAYFVHASGLRFEAKVTLESSTATDR